MRFYNFSERAYQQERARETGAASFRGAKTEARTGAEATATG